MILLLKADLASLKGAGGGRKREKQQKMQPLSLTPMEDWAVLEVKPDRMVLAATSWPGKTLSYWKTCFSFALLLQAFTQGQKGWSSFHKLNQALRRCKGKMGNVGKSSKEMILCVTQSNCVIFSGVRVLQWLQASSPLDIAMLSGTHTMDLGTVSISIALRFCLSNLCYYSWHLSLICASITILHEESITLHLID